MDLRAMSPYTWYALLPLGLFFVYSLLVYGEVEGITALDSAWLDTMASLVSPRLTDMMNLVSLVGSTAFVYSVSLVLFVHMWKSRMKEPITSFFALIVTASVSVNICKYIFRMPRPPDPLLHASGYAYPSGHVVLATTFYVGLAYVLYRWGRLSRATAFLFAAAMSIAMGLSRTYLSVHYLSDVVGGYLLALGIVALFYGWLSRSLSCRDIT